MGQSNIYIQKDNGDEYIFPYLEEKEFFVVPPEKYNDSEIRNKLENREEVSQIRHPL